MDRGTKLMFGMLTAAVCLMVIMMISREAPQAHAEMYQGDRGEELTIVSFRVTPIMEEWTATGTANNCGNSCSNGLWGAAAAPTRKVMLTRMWSDGTVEINIVDESEWSDGFTGWKLVTDSFAGFRCAGDTDGNREVNVNDVLTVLKDYGNCELDPPLNLPPDSDL